MQIPFSEPLTKWSLVCIDAKSLLREILEIGQEGKNKSISLPEAQDLDIELTSVQLCAKMYVKGVYTTDTFYIPKTLPKEMSFRLSKNEKFEQSYNWYLMNSFANPIVNTPPVEADKENLAEESNRLREAELLRTAEMPKKSILKKTQPQSDKRSSPSKAKAKPIDFADTSKREADTVDRGFESKAQDKRKSVKIVDDKYHEEREEHKYSTKYEDNPYEEYEQEEPVAEVKEEQVRNIKFKTDHFTLEPNPIMSLTHFQGFQSNGKNLLLLDDNSIVYSCGNTICLMDVKSRIQRFFIGQKDQVSCLALHAKQNILISADDSDKNSRLHLWSLYPQTLQTSFFSGLGNIRCCDIATKVENQKKQTLLLVVGKDQLKRDVIVLYDITDFANKEPYVLCKKISDFDIRSARFIEKREATQFITCGKESIRFWRLKNKAITGTSLVLNEHGRDTIFNDFCVFNFEDYVSTGQPSEGIRGNYKVVFCSDKGNVYLVDYKEEVMYGIFKLHEGGITSLNMNPTNHYFITSGEDKMIRLWNMDVTQMLLEVKVDSQINNLLLNNKDQVSYL